VNQIALGAFPPFPLSAFFLPEDGGPPPPKGALPFFFSPPFCAGCFSLPPFPWAEEQSHLRSGKGHGPPPQKKQHLPSRCGERRGAPVEKNTSPSVLRGGLPRDRGDKGTLEKREKKIFNLSPSPNLPPATTSQKGLPKRPLSSPPWPLSSPPKKGRNLTRTGKPAYPLHASPLLIRFMRGIFWSTTLETLIIAWRLFGRGIFFSILGGEGTLLLWVTSLIEAFSFYPQSMFRDVAPSPSFLVYCGFFFFFS